jgi:hypothetical protein
MADPKKITMQDIMDITVERLQEETIRELRGDYDNYYYGPIRIPFRYKIQKETHGKTQSER